MIIFHRLGDSTETKALTAAPVSASQDYIITHEELLVFKIIHYIRTVMIPSVTEIRFFNNYSEDNYCSGSHLMSVPGSLGFEK